jgi:hypothetical protein
MAKTLAKTIAERELNKLVSVCEHEIDVALDRLVEWVTRHGVSMLTYHQLRGFLHGQAFTRKYPAQDVFQRLLSRLKLPENQWLALESISQKWFGIHDRPLTDYLAQGIVSELAPFWSAEIKNFDRIDFGLWMYRLRFPNVHLRYFDEDVFLIVITDPQSAPNQFEIIKRSLIEKGVQARVSLVLVLGNGEQVRELAKKESIQIIVIDEYDSIDILLSDNSKHTFCTLAASRISIKILQPYQTRGKVRNRMFYGRQEEINRLKNNLSSNFAIYGGRLIGKSSLLHQIEQEFVQDENLGYKASSITAQVTSPVEVCRTILKDLGIPTATHRTIGTFERLMRDYLEPSHRKVVVLIDEIDDLIAQDEHNEYQLFETFHNLSNDYGERCRFIFAGYRDLARHCMDSNTRFRNFVETIKLGNLSELHAKLLIEDPLVNELGFKFDDGALVDRIVQITGCHPNYIQVFCKELSEYLDGKRRKILYDDIDVIFENDEFRSRIVETFYVNFSPIQQLITILVILENLEEFSLPDAIKLMNQYESKLHLDISRVYIEIRQLEMSFVVEQVGPKYRFAHKLFPQMLESREDLYGLADIIIKQLKGE